MCQFEYVWILLLYKDFLQFIFKVLYFWIHSENDQIL